MLVSGALGLVVFVTYPVAPPRLAGLGLVDTVTRAPTPTACCSRPRSSTSTPRCRACTSAGTCWSASRSSPRPPACRCGSIGCLMPVLMALAVVATANHYVVDVVAGVALVLVGHGSRCGSSGAACRRAPSSAR